MSSTQTLKLEQVVADGMDAAKAFAQAHAMAGLTYEADEAGQPVITGEGGARFVFDAISKHFTLGDGRVGVRGMTGGEDIGLLFSEDVPHGPVMVVRPQALTTEDVVGRWTCTSATQEQSAEEEEEFGPYDDFGAPRELTEYHSTTFEFAPDGTYRHTGIDDATRSHGTWAIDETELKLTESDDCINGYEGIVWSGLQRGRLNVGFKLCPDAHDGLDVVALTFERTADT